MSDFSSAPARAGGQSQADHHRKSRSGRRGARLWVRVSRIEGCMSQHVFNAFANASLFARLVRGAGTGINGAVYSEIACSPSFKARLDGVG